jgi:hypothetical protein
MHLLMFVALTTNAQSLNSLLVEVSALVGLGLPLLVAIVQREKWPNWVRTVVGVTAVLIASVVTAAAQHKLNVNDWAASVLTIFLMTKTSYLAVWKPSGVAPYIEAQTSPAAARKPAGKKTPPAASN